jgi:hypothetical protein
VTSPLVTAAVEYLNLGLAVIALTGKTPNVEVHKRGLYQALEGAPDPEDLPLLQSVFEHPATTGIGIVIRYPYVVVDIDGPDGAEQWLALNGTDIDGFAGPDITWAAKTGRGLHLWYACLTPTGTIKLDSKLDLKAEGGYVVAPPSQHPDGGTYRWLVPPSAEEPPKEVPEALRERIEDHAFDMQAKLGRKEERRNAWGPKYAEGDHVFYAQASHDALIEGMKTALDGNRNNYLHWAAATLAEEAGSDEEFELLASTALEAGLDSVEVKRTIRSARRSHV